MLSVIILGTGNVAENLFFAFQGTKHIAVEQVFGRNPSSLQKFAKKVDVVSDYADIAQADIYIIAVSDKALGNVAEKLSDKKGLVVHTSGAEAMDAIKSKNRGVFYPLQTFTKGRVLGFRDIPICIEARTNTGLEQLKQLAQSISRSILIVDSGKRKKIHTLSQQSHLYLSVLRVINASDKQSKYSSRLTDGACHLRVTIRVSHFA